MKPATPGVVAKAIPFWLFAIAACVHATTPPPPVSTEEVLCRSDLVFIGKADDFRLVRVRERADMCEAFNPDAESLDHCTAVQVTVRVDEVLFSKLEAGPSAIEFRFGGGLFSARDLRRDLLGQSLLFHVIPQAGGPAGVYTTSYPWRLALAAARAGEARAMLAQCKRS